MARPDLTLIELQWGSFEYLNMEQNGEWTVAKFIAALGGSIGMWLGLSIVSLIQGGSYVFTVCSKRLKKKQAERKRIDAGPDPDGGKKISKKLSIGANPFASPYGGEVQLEPMPENGK
ncbi:hypothetical protein PENTCL1PPCAC_14143, partial [Pristionchus entomophagus]